MSKETVKDPTSDPSMSAYIEIDKGITISGGNETWHTWTTNFSQAPCVSVTTSNGDKNTVSACGTTTSGTYLNTGKGSNCPVDIIAIGL